MLCAFSTEPPADFASFENALSIVTRRFKVASPIKNSQYHKEWNKLITRAKKLKQIDMSQMDLKKRNQSFLIGLFGRITENLDKGMPAGVEPEVLKFSKISPILKELETELRKMRTERNNISNSPIDGDRKRQMPVSVCALVLSSCGLASETSFSVWESSTSPICLRLAACGAPGESSD